MMNEKILMIIPIGILLGCGTSLLVSEGKKVEEEKVLRPNILFIYTDDQAPWDIGIGNNYEGGTKNYITRKDVNGSYQTYTPNLDQLAKDGAYFPNAYVTTPVCSPARVALLTGQYASEYGVYDFIPPPGHKLYDPEQEIALSPNSITFPEILQHNGYETGLVGKWHVGDWVHDPSRKHHPLNNGYDYFMGLTGGGAAPKDPTLEEDGEIKKFEGYTYDILTDHAISYIESNTDKPFLLSLHYRAPHGRWLPVPEEDWEPYEDMDPDIPNPDYPDLKVNVVKKRMKEYMASTTGVDRNVGRVMRLLKELNIEENTIVIFTSDHGYNMGHNGIDHKGNGNWITKTPPPAQENIARNSRPNMYENSLKVPVIIKWPKVVKPGTVHNEFITSLDWYPTIAEMTDSEVPPQKILRGQSIVPILKGKKVNWDNDIYAEYSMINYSKAYMRSYRTEDWKLVKDFLNPGRDELYYIAEDPEEHDNIISEATPEIEEIKKDLTQKILQKMREIGDPLLKRLVSDNMELH